MAWRIRVRRPNGQIETIEKLGDHMTDAFFSRVKAQTKAAGRGDVLSYENFEPARPAAVDPRNDVERAWDEYVGRMENNDRQSDPSKWQDAAGARREYERLAVTHPEMEAARLRNNQARFDARRSSASADGIDDGR